MCNEVSHENAFGTLRHSIPDREPGRRACGAVANRHRDATLWLASPVKYSGREGGDAEGIASSSYREERAGRRFVSGYPEVSPFAAGALQMTHEMRLRDDHAQDRGRMMQLGEVQRQIEEVDVAIQQVRGQVRRPR